MPGGGTQTFVDPIGYEASLREGLIEAVITVAGPFAARLTVVKLHHLQLLRCEEDRPRIAYLSLARQLVFVTFPFEIGPAPVWRGAAMRPGDILFHSQGDRLHQRTDGRSIWGVIALDPEELEDNARALAGAPLLPPPAGTVLRPAPRAAARLRRLFSQACRLAETKTRMLTHTEVARAIEQGLLEALVCCLARTAALPLGARTVRHAPMMLRLEEVLAEHLTRPLRIPDLSGLLGVGARSLRAGCDEFLGVSPGSYVLLRRLRQARIAMRAADPATTSLAEVARAAGFARPHRLVTAYRAAFGEAPATAARRPSRTNFGEP
jgi:AraC-like DNA-binding protein